MNTYFNAHVWKMFENAFNLPVPMYNYGLGWSLYYIDHYHFATQYFKFYLHSSIEHSFPSVTNKHLYTQTYVRIYVISSW